MKLRTWIRIASTLCVLFVLGSLVNQANSQNTVPTSVETPSETQPTSDQNVDLRHGEGSPPGHAASGGHQTLPPPQSPPEQGARPVNPGASSAEVEALSGKDTSGAQADLDGPTSLAEASLAGESTDGAGEEEGAAAAEKSKLDCAANGAQSASESFLQLLSVGDLQGAYGSTAAALHEVQSLDDFTGRVQDSNLIRHSGVEWTNCVEAKDGLRLDARLALTDGTSTTASVFLLGDSQQDSPEWQVLDVLETDSVFTRIASGNFKVLDFVVLAGILGVLGGLVFIIVSYSRGLKGSPRELYLLFFTKVTEYSAYGAFLYTAVQYLVSDMGMSKMEAGSYFSLWSIGMSVTVMLVGAVCDAIGIKNTLLIGCFTLLIARFFLPIVGHWFPATILGFLPLAIGIAITSPVLKVGIKKYTTQEGAALGFALFYTLMNVGFAIGGWYYQKIRNVLGETVQHTQLSMGGLDIPLPFELSTYQIIIGIGFFLTIPDLAAILWMRKGVERTEDGVVIHPVRTWAAKGGLLTRIVVPIKEASKATGEMLATNFREKPFWIYLFLLGVLVFVKVTFFIFSVMFPSYMVSVFGPGARVDIFGVFNPLLIVFFVPLIAVMTRKVASYKMLLLGTSISALSVFLVYMPESVSQALADSWMGSLVFDYWIELPHGQRDPFYMAMIIFIFFFTIGEAIWSPRLMQFSAEIAPRGREGSYIALAILPYFVAKFVVGGLSGWLLTKYTPEGQTVFDQHHLVWAWIGGIAMFSPVGLIVFRGLFKQAETANRALDPEPEPEPEASTEAETIAIDELEASA